LFKNLCCKNYFVEIQVRNFLRKLQLEESRREERLRGLEDSRDAVAAATAREAVAVRYQQARKKLQVTSRLDPRLDAFSAFQKQGTPGANVATFWKRNRVAAHDG